MNQRGEGPATPGSARYGAVLVILAALWISTTSWGLQSLTWIAENLFLTTGLEWPTWSWFLVTVVQGMCIAVAAVPASVFWRERMFSSIFRTWVLAAIFVLILSPIRLVHPPNTQLANLLQIGLCGLIIILLLLGGRSLKNRRLRSADSFGSVPYLALTAGVVLTFPWLAWGALGSPLDTALNLLSGLMFGAAVAMILDYELVPYLRARGQREGRDLLFAGLATGTTLVAMSSAFGFNGMQLLIMLSVPALFVAVPAVGRYGRSESQKTDRISMALLIGITSAAPMMFVDPDELNFILVFGTRDIPYWAFSAAVVSMLAGTSLSAGLFLARRHLAGAKSRLPLLFSTILALAVGGFIYFGMGQTGFYGDQLFVIMKDQVDLNDSSRYPAAQQGPVGIYRELTSLATSSQARIQEYLRDRGTEFTSYYLVNSLAVKGSPILRSWLESQPEVDRVIENPILRPLPSPADVASGSAGPPSGPTWNLTRIGADRVWDEFGANGSGIVIGHADSGVQANHPELADSYRGLQQGDAYNWFDPWYHSASPQDLSGHGTHTLGTALGRSTGVAPGAQWIACANLTRGLGNPALYLDCLQFLFAPFPPEGDPFTDGDPSLGANIINNSWLCPKIEGCDETTLIEAAEVLRYAGIFMAVAAGNEGPGCGTVDEPMATFDQVFSVGAIAQNGELASFSSIGPSVVDGRRQVKPDIVAPGVTILSAFPRSSYQTLAGTSMAAPHVAGVVALMWSANPSLVGDIENTEQILQATASPYLGPVPECVSMEIVPNNATGYGFLDAYEAVREAMDYS